ncbi:MAG TPA: ADOP family duplicated permease [Vicinamibacterales bacterium]|nr:ADOP family duplicated permease [Vicinamibacterales bacterium]
MNRDRLLRLSDRWFRLLIRCYPPDFRDDMGQAVVEAYRDRARAAVSRGGLVLLAGVWIRALLDATRNGIGEWFSPAASWRRAGNWRRDAEFATRRLLRAPASAAAIVATLTVGLGMFAIVYTVFHKVLVEPMPHEDPEDLYFVWRDYGKIFDLKRGWLGGPDVAELRTAGGVIEGVAPLARQQATFAVGEGAEAAEIAVMVTSPNLFELLGVPPAMGRGFAPNEAGPGRPPLIVLTHGLWNRYGADPSIVGRDVRLNGEAYTVIGVMPKEFRFMRHSSLGSPRGADAYTTVTVNLVEEDPGGGSYAGLIRARPGRPPRTVAAAVDAVGRALDARHFNNQGLKLYPTGMKEDLIAGIRPAIVVIGFAGLFLLLILMVNLATVLLARAAQREHEFAVSRALGASGATVFRATLFEGALLGLLGGAAGALWAVWGTRTLVALAPVDLPRRDTIALDWPLGLTVVGTGMLLGLLAAVVPAVWATRSSLSSLLASSAVRGGGGHGRMRRGMVVVQVALSLVLLTAGGLVVRSFERLLRADPGFRPEGLVTIRVPLPPQGFPENKDVFAAQDRIHQALSAIPGVRAVSAVDALPLTAGARQADITIPGAPGLTGDAQKDAPLVDVIAAHAGYVETMGMRLVAGRTFHTRPPEGVYEGLIDRQLAARFFPSGNPLGAEIPLGQNRVTVVGVVEQARMYGVHEDGRPQLYIRADQWVRRRPAFVLRADRHAQAIMPDVRAALRRVDSRLALGEVVTMEEIARQALSQERVSAVMIAGFALGALVLAAMGVYGVIAGSVTRRRHELAVRLALGANHPRVLRLVLAEGARLVALGMLIGVPGVYFAGGLLQGVLVGIAPTDPVTLAGVAVGLGAVAMLACYAPARRVLRIEPAQALRES